MGKIKGQRMEAVGKLRQSVVTSSDGEIVFMQFEDKLSGLLIAEIQMDFEAFGKMLASNGTVEVEYKMYKNFEKLGKRAVINNEMIHIGLLPFDHDERQRQFRKYVERSDEYFERSIGGWEVNNWEYNSRHHRSDGLYPVSFIKFVEVND